MAPVTKRTERENRLDASLAFATNLENNIRSESILPSLNVNLYKEIDRVPLIHNAAATGRIRELDEQGTRLWNLTPKLKKESAASMELVCLVRIFACLLLDKAQSCTTDDIRVLKSMLKASKHCLDQRQLSLADVVIEKAAFYNERLAGVGDLETHENSIVIDRLSKEYYTLRIALAWRQDRLDLADLMLTKLGHGSVRFEPSVTEDLADLFFEIGTDQATKSRHSEAVRWFGKAYDALAGQSTEALSNDAGELRISIMHGMVRALIETRGDESNKKAWNIVTELEIEFDDRLAVNLLKLDLYQADTASSPQDYCSVLQKIVRSVHLTESNVKTVLHHVHWLRAHDSRMAHTVLDTLVSDRLLGVNEPQWLEKALITIIWNLTTSTDPSDALNLLGTLFNTLATNSSGDISQSATHAAHMLMWKCIETNYNQGAYDKAKAWCRLSLHEIFRKSGELNIGKLQRKFILCALAMSDLATAREIYCQMSETNQRHPSTKYLLYKVALRTGDASLAAECLDTISSVTVEDANLLYACVLEAQRIGDRIQTVAALRRVVQNYDYRTQGRAHVPALLRCTARLLIPEMEHTTLQTSDNIDEICKLFEGAAVHARNSQRLSKDSLFSLPELDWFSRSSYNLALRSCTSWAPLQTLRLVQACLKIIDLYPSDIAASDMADLSLRKMFCEFLGGSLLIVLARGEDVVEIQLQHYLGVRQFATNFRTHLQEQLSRLEGGAKDDLLRKFSSILAFDFEAAARLKAWASFEQLVEDCHVCEEPVIYGVLADIALSSDAPSKTIIATLRQIINVTSRLNDSDIDKISRWIRCLFSLAVNSETEIAEDLLDQVVTIAGHAKSTSKPYPAEEIEWLATTTFNRAVDFYCSSWDAACRRWAGKALGIANLCNDEGALQDLLQSKYMGLTWDH